jgi:hypothetical protein
MYNVGLPLLRFIHKNLQHNEATVMKMQSVSVNVTRGGSRISGTGGGGCNLWEGPHTASAEGAKHRVGVCGRSSPETFENSSANMRFPGIWV